MQKTTIRGTTVYCDFKATTGAVLYDAAWMTERDLQRALLEHSKLIVATPGRYSAHFRLGIGAEGSVIPYSRCPAG